MPRLIYIMKESGDPSLRLSAFWTEKRIAQNKYGDEEESNESFRMVPGPSR